MRKIHLSNSKSIQILKNTPNKPLIQLSIKGDVIRLTKNIYERPTATVIFHTERLMFSEMENGTRICALNTPMQACAGGPTQCNKEQEKRTRSMHTDGEGRNETVSLCRQSEACRPSLRVYWERLVPIGCLSRLQDTRSMWKFNRSPVLLVVNNWKLK